MPFNQEQLAYGGRAVIDNYVKNKPIDQINTAHPFYEMAVSKKKTWGGGLQFVVEQLRFSNDSNFQSYFGDGQVTYNRKRTLNQAKFSWGSFHDGFGLNEDELAQAGIIVTDDRTATPTDAEKVRLTNLIEENTETLKLGFVDNFDIMLHRSGAQNVNDIPGLDSLISLTPAVGVVGTLDAATTPLWRNYAASNVAQAAYIQGLELAWQSCILRGGKAPDVILAGQAAINVYRAQAVLSSGSGITRQVVVGGSGGNMKGTTLDASIGNGVSTGLYFKGVEIKWDPTFEQLDTLDAPALQWTRRMYFLNSDTICLRPIEGHWMVSRRPPRVYDRYTHYWGLTGKAALTVNQRNANAVIHVA
jgi:hypothetical protein